MMLRGHVKEGNSQRQVKMLILTLCCAVCTCAVWLCIMMHIMESMTLWKSAHTREILNIWISQQNQKTFKNTLACLTGAELGFKPNYHSPLKLLSYHGLDGKSWFKSKGPFGTLGRDYKVVSTVFLPFSDCAISHVHPSPSTGKKHGKHLWLYALFKHRY